MHCQFFEAYFATRIYGFYVLLLVQQFQRLNYHLSLEPNHVSDKDTRPHYQKKLVYCLANS